jgi:hypothetical protein
VVVVAVGVGAKLGDGDPVALGVALAAGEPGAGTVADGVGVGAVPEHPATASMITLARGRRTFNTMPHRRTGFGADGFQPMLSTLTRIPSEVVARRFPPGVEP